MYDTNTLTYYNMIEFFFYSVVFTHVKFKLPLMELF